MKKFAFLLTTYITLSGCHLTDSTQTLSSPKPKNEMSKNNTRPFTKDTLYDLLLAEIAEQRGNNQLAQDNYISQASQTKDPQVASRAYQMASSTNNRPMQRNMALLWVSIAPNDIQANKAAALNLAIDGQLEALPYLKKILATEATLDFLSLETANLSSTENTKLLSVLDLLVNDYPNTPSLNYTRAILLAETKQNEQALSALATLPPAQAQTDDIILLKVQILDAMDKKDEANTLLNNAITSKADNKNLRLNLAHRLITQGKIKEAKQQYLLVKQQDPNDYEILFGLSILCLETKEYDEAITYLQQILEQGIQSSNIYFYLALAYDQQGDKEEALTYYAQVSSGDNYLMSIVNSATILFDQNKISQAQQLLAKARQNNPTLASPLYLFETNTLQKINKTKLAWQTINNAVKASPKDTTLIYTRALLAAETNRIAQAEKDLRYLIKIDPKNDTALNALGYTLASHTKRYKEALSFVQRAFELNPESPATLDSLGWVYYKLGNLTEAVYYSKAAYQLDPDPEIAAHLGEILWKQGDKEQAKMIWQEGLKTDEPNALLLQTIKHFTGKKEL